MKRLTAAIFLLLSMVTHGQVELVDSLNNLSRSFVTSDLQKAEDYGRRALMEAENIDYPKGEVAAHFNIGNRYYIGAEYAKTMEHYLSALRILEEEGDKQGQASALMGIGNVMMAQDKVDEAIDYQMRSLEIRKEIGDSVGIAGNYNNLGSTYMDLGEYDKALDYHRRSLEIKEALGHYEGLSSSHGNMGVCLEKLGRYDEALEHQLQAFEIRKDLNNKKGQVMSHTDIGKLLARKGDYDEAIDRLEQSVDLASEVGFGDGYLGALKAMAEVYEMAGSHADALRSFKRYHRANDSIFSAETSKEISELEAVYDNEKKQKKIALLEKDNKIKEQNERLQKAELRRQRYLIFGAAGVLLLAVFGIWMLVRRNRLKQRMNKELEDRNALITEKNTIIEERNKDITDSIEYAKTIQSHLLPSKEIFRDHLKEHFILYLPRDIVSGDFYWAHHENGKTFLVVSDCTGHGVPGALLSMLGQNMLNQIVIDRGIHDPGTILTSLNDRIHSTFNKGGDRRFYDGMDITIMLIEDGGSKVQWAAANHYVLLRRDGDVTRIDGDRMPIGGRSEPGQSFATRDIDRKEGDEIYMLSDGYVDQFGGEKGKKFKLNGFIEKLRELDGSNMSAQLEGLSDHFESWKGEFEQIDDVTVIGARI